MIPSSRVIHRRMRLCVIVMMSLSLLAFSLQEGAAVLLVVATACGVGWWFNEQGKSLSLPRWATNILLVAMLATAVLRGWMERDAISSFQWLLTLVLIVKIWERRRAGDYGQIITVCIFLTIGATLSDVSLPLGLILLAQAILLPFAVMWYQLHAASERATGSPRDLDTPARKRLRRSVRRWSLTTSVLSIVIATAVFIFVPRGIGMGQFGEASSTSRVTGFRDFIDLNLGGTISESQAPVLELRVTDGFDQPIGSESRAWYLRGAVLDTYRNGSWSRSPEVAGESSTLRRLTRAITESHLWRSRDEPTSPDPRRVVIQQVRMLQAVSGETSLFGVHRPLWVSVPGGGDLWYDSLTGGIVLRDAARDLSYTVRSLPEIDESRVSRDARGLVSFPSELVYDEAARVLAQASIPIDPAQRDRSDDSRALRLLEAHLRTSFTYTLQGTPPPLNAEPIEWFLRDARRGHCEQFAAALAAMSLAAGVPARVVAGYVANEFDEARDLYIVRAANAHAWVEAQIAPGVWRTFDPTPPGSLTQARMRQTGLRAAFARAADSLQNAWSSRFIGFDLSAQNQMFGGDSARRPWFMAVDEWAGTPSGRRGGVRPGSGWRNLLWWIIGAGVSLALLRGAAVLYKRFAFPARRPGRHANLHLLHSERALLAAVRHAFKRLDPAAGSEVSTPLLGRAVMLRRVHGEAAQPLVDAAEALYAAAFGRRPLSPDRAALLVASVKRVRRPAPNLTIAPPPIATSSATT